MNKKVLKEIKVIIEDDKLIGMIVGKQFNNIKRICVDAGKKYNTKIKFEIVKPKNEKSYFKLESLSLEALQMVKESIQDKQKLISLRSQQKEKIIPLEYYVCKKH